MGYKNLQELVGLLEKLKAEYIKNTKDGNTQKANLIKQEIEKLIIYIKKVKEEEELKGYTTDLSNNKALIAKEVKNKNQGNIVNTKEDKVTKEVQEEAKEQESTNSVKEDEVTKAVKEQEDEVTKMVKEKKDIKSIKESEVTKVIKEQENTKNIKEDKVVKESKEQEGKVAKEAKEQVEEQEGKVAKEAKEQVEEQEDTKSIKKDKTIKETEDEAKSEEQENIKEDKLTKETEDEEKQATLKVEAINKNLSPKDQLKMLKLQAKELEKNQKEKEKLSKVKQKQVKKQVKKGKRKEKISNIKTEAQNRKKRKEAQKMELKYGTLIIFVMLFIVLILDTTRGGIFNLAQQKILNDHTVNYANMYGFFIRLYNVIVLITFTIFIIVQNDLRKVKILQIFTYAGLVTSFISFNGLKLVGLDIKFLSGDNYLFIPGILVIIALYYLSKNLVRDKILIDYEIEIEE
ncbi:MAG: hypothetical protein ACK5HR_04470 [Mycoplasmatales bacterium]